MTDVTEDASANGSDCPDCENDVLSVHGIDTCSACSWVTPEFR